LQILDLTRLALRNPPDSAVNLGKTVRSQLGKSGATMSTNEFFQYLMTYSQTKDLAAQLASAYLQRAAAPASAAA
jgi:hypothetical protein